MREDIFGRDSLRGLDDYLTREPPDAPDEGFATDEGWASLSAGLAKLEAERDAAVLLASQWKNVAASLAQELESRDGDGVLLRTALMKQHGVVSQ